MGRINLYDNYSQIVDEVLSEIGQYDLTGLNLARQGRPVYDAIVDNYQLKFKQAMGLYPWRFASKVNFLHNKNEDPNTDGFVSTFEVPIAAGDYYNIWDISLADAKKTKETFVAKVLENGNVITNYKLKDDDDGNKTVYAQLVVDVEPAQCPVYFMNLYKNVLKQFIGWLLHDIGGIATLALKEYPAVLQQAVNQDTQLFSCNTVFEIKTPRIPRW